MTLDFTGAGSRGRRQGRGWVEAGEKPLSLSQDKREGRAVCNTAHTAHTHERRSCEYTGSVSQRRLGAQRWALEASDILPYT